MVTMTIRNIPDAVIGRIRMLSESERRSMNSEILMALEKGTDALVSAKNTESAGASPAVRSRMWKEMCGQWRDTKSVYAAVAEIYASRSDVPETYRDGNT